MRFLIPIASTLALLACAPTVPDSGAGFQSMSDYQALQAEREERLRGSIPDPSATAISGETIDNGAPVPTTVAPTVTVDLNNPGISDEQSFSAVASRETIESDRQRLAAQSEAYQTIQPTALPTRTGGSGPSVVDFALSTSNAVGQSIYKRTGIGAQARFERNCAKYTSSDLAQIAFLRSGGPERDRDGLDPDGDGFACYWDPTPFRRAAQG